MWRLATAGAGDAVKLSCFPPEEWRGTDGLDLDALTEFKRGSNGVVELKFVDRGRLLERLRELYQLDQDYQQYNKIGARVIAKDSGAWFQVFRINKGSADGVRVDANVIAGGGLVGIVTDVGANYATVRSIIDDVSRVSAMAQQSGDTCFVEGDLTLFSEGRLRISKITKDGDVKDGDRIVTSNVSSKYLPGILIGYATNVTTDDTRLTKSGYLVPAAKFNNLQEVLVILELKEDQTDGDLPVSQGEQE